MDLYTALIPLVGTIATFLSLTIILYIYFTTRNKERLALIAKDKDSSIWRNKNQKTVNLKFAALLVGFGVGAGLGLTLSDWGIIPDEVVFLGLVPFCMGVALFLYHRMTSVQGFDDEV